MTAAPVLVPLYCVFAGVWARFTGIGRDRTPLVVDGAVIGGPDETDFGGQPMYAVLVRTYRPEEDDVLLFMPRDTMVELVDETDRDVIRAQALAPVFGPGSLHVEIRRRQPGIGRRSDQWSREYHEDVDPKQLDAWRADHDMNVKVLSAAVYRRHLPIRPGVL